MRICNVSYEQGELENFVETVTLYGFSVLGLGIPCINIFLTKIPIFLVGRISTEYRNISVEIRKCVSKIWKTIIVTPFASIGRMHTGRQLMQQLQSSIHCSL